MTSPLATATTPLPIEVIDAHHHFLDTTNNEFQSFLGKFVPNESYLPEHYDRDVLQPLQQAGVTVTGSVHVECMPDDGSKEAAWIESLSSSVKAIVGSCDLASSTVGQDLQKLKESSTRLRGVRWILDCVGPFEPDTATHVATTRHDGIDYLRGSNGGYDGGAVPAFERGFAMLEQHQLGFDLQCAPAQLLQAAKLFSKYPNIPVCIDHLGKPRMLFGSDDSTNTDPNKGELEVWREGMKAMAKLSHVHVKISMLGYAIPGWTRSPARVELMKKLVQEVVDMFGADRCMVALNWWKDGACSDADGLSSVGPDPVDFLRYMSYFFEDYGEQDRKKLFVETARKFYRF
jgi:predicted TIM-barrel fold metal-dependent hydrolase